MTAHEDRLGIDWVAEEKRLQSRIEARRRTLRRSRSREESRLVRIAVLSCLGVIAICLSVAVALAAFLGPPKEAGTFGDQFGVANAIFSGLAFVGVIVAILLQRLELRSQREELDLSREENMQALLAQRRSEHSLRRRVAQEERFAISKTTLALFDEWHSPVLHEHRITATTVVNRFQGIAALPTLSQFERAQESDQLPLQVATDDHGSPLVVSRSEATSVFAVVHFFEKWAALQSCGRLDPELMPKLIGSFSAWWGRVLIRPLRRSEEKNPDMLGVLDMIIANVLEADAKPPAQAGHDQGDLG